MLVETHKTEIDTLLTRYASRRSAVLPLLYIAQDHYGHLTQEAIREVADILHLPPTDVFEVVGFYTLFYDKPVGTWMLQVCDDVPCCYLGAEELISALKSSLGIQEEQTTADGMFTLQRVKCLAACNRAPVLQANIDYVYDVTADKAEVLLKDLRARAAEAQRRGRSGRQASDVGIAADGELYATTVSGRPVVQQPTAQVPAPATPEPVKVAEQATEPAVAEVAKEAAEERIAAESPVAPSPDRSPGGDMPVPEKQDEHGAVPAQAAQQEPPAEVSSEEAKQPEKPRISPL